MAGERGEDGVAEAERDGVGRESREEGVGDGGGGERVAGRGEAREEGVVVVEAKVNDAGMELGEAAKSTAAAEEGRDRRGWAAGGGGHAAAAASGEAGDGIWSCVWGLGVPFGSHHIGGFGSQPGLAYIAVVNGWAQEK